MSRGMKDPTSQAELLAPAWRDQVGVLAVPDDPVPHERAVGQDHQVPLPDGVETRLHEAAGYALAAEPVVGLGIGERDLVAAQVILDKPGELAVGDDLEPFLIRIVGNLQVHDTSEDPGYPPVPSEMAKSRASWASGGQGRAASGSRLNHSFIGVPLLASNRSPSLNSSTSCSYRSSGVIVLAWQAGSGAWRGGRAQLTSVA